MLDTGPSQLILWDPRPTGHHLAYLRAALLAALNGPWSEIWIPAWAGRYLGRGDSRVKLLPDGSRLGDLRGEPEFAHPQLTVLLDGNNELPYLARHGWPGRLRIVDIRCQQTDVKYTRTLPRRLFGAWHLALREVLVRRTPTTLLSLDHRSDSIGSKTLRSHLNCLPELAQDCPDSRGPDRASGERSETKEAVIIGSLDRRKGVGLTLDALKSDPSLRVRVSVIGQPVPEYEIELERLKAKARGEGLPMQFNLNALPWSEYCRALHQSHIVLLPYQSHRGGSGILASLQDYTGQVIVSDFGWLGHLAGRQGLRTFQNGNAEDLARALREAQQSDASAPLNLECDLYAHQRAFGRIVIGEACRH